MWVRLLLWLSFFTLLSLLYYTTFNLSTYNSFYMFIFRQCIYSTETRERLVEHVFNCHLLNHSNL